MIKKYFILCAAIGALFAEMNLHSVLIAFRVKGWQNKALRQAVKKGDVSEVTKLIEQYKANVNAKTTKNLRTPLHRASALEDSEIAEKLVKKLLAAGALPNAKDKFRKSPLHFACEWGVEGKGAVVKALIKAGSRLNDQSFYSKETPLHIACARGSVDNVKALINAGANPNVYSIYGVPLHRAFRFYQVDLSNKIGLFGEEKFFEIVKMLIRAGANPFIENRHGEKALPYAERKKFVQTIVPFKKDAIIKETTFSIIETLLFSVTQGKKTNGDSK
ncbi:TPA: hypothetical protein DDZ86_01035 [Candidatus Dependentiae bacterium]|nr:MAG: hypothetical protein UW09_C0004G0089 [candidate division TM6 bacterium GW2011_GWF2_43_87]HBL98210.1 hypothetical protein [Candidatus Dependentiae bacterium]